MLGLDPKKVSSTLCWLRACRVYRDRHGEPYDLRNDPRRLVHIAINRKAGWPDDPEGLFSSAMPVNGKYPARAAYDRYMSLWRISRDINTPRLIVRLWGMDYRWRRLLMERVPHRITTPEQEADW